MFFNICVLQSNLGAIVIRGILILLCLHLNATIFATHIIGGEIFYDHLGDTQYEITVILYRDCNSNINYDQDLPLSVFDGNGNHLVNIDIPFPGSQQLVVEFNNPCVIVPHDICVEEAVYKVTATLPSSSTGYTLSYQRCCRTAAVINLSNPANQGITLTIDIPPNSTVTSNSSPRFNNIPPLLLCANEQLIFDHSATDPDGDSVAYDLFTPLQGGGLDYYPPNCATCPTPIPAAAPPYNSVSWLSGMNATNPYGNGTISIDPQTGILQTTPVQTGLYVVGVRAKEYRNGTLLSTSIRDFMFKIINCDVELEAIIVPQADLSTFESYCQGLTVNFENDSYGGDTYHWDFGVDSISTDVSNLFAPTYTYPAPGTYVVTLIVNAGMPCSDTTTELFTVQNEIEAFFEPPEPQCISGNSFEFIGDGQIPANGATFEWNFGNQTIQGTSGDQNPIGIEYLSSGIYPVTFTVYYDQCESSYTDTVVVHGHPTILFSIEDELKCAPYEAEFINFSTSTSPLQYTWDFGDGIGTSNDQHPVYLYQAPGVYDVTLTIWTTEGCIDTLTLERPNLIEVFPAPVSQFEVSPDEQDEYHAEFEFTDLSQNGVEVWYHFGDGYSGEGPNTLHYYQEPGVYHPWQVVTNEYGCQDISYEELKVTPVIPVMVPNAFTPDGNTYNNTFYPVFYENQPYEMWIYNRWGELVFQTEGKRGGWDGTGKDGTLVPDDVYIWRIRYYEYDTGMPIEIQGHVTLLK